MIDATIISSIELVVFGVLIIVFFIFEPLGMAKLWGNLKAWFRRRAFPHPTLAPSQENIRIELLFVLRVVAYLGLFFANNFGFLSGGD